MDLSVKDIKSRAVKQVTAITEYGLDLIKAPPVDAQSAPGEDLRAALRPLIRLGLIVIVGFFGVFGGWAAVAPLSSAALAPGQVSPEGSRRVVQHLEGGLISELHVHDGDRVKAGDPLVQLAQTQSLAQHQVHIKERAALAAVNARLTAEQDDAGAVQFPDWLSQEARLDESINAVVVSQKELFETRRRTHQSRLSILRKRIDQLREEIAGLQAQIASQREQSDLLAEEVADVETLLEEGLARRPRLLDLRRRKAGIEERIAANRAAIARAEQTIGEAQLQIAATDAMRLDEVGASLVDVASRLATVNEKLAASGDILERTVITAPTSGVVMSSRYTSPGGVIAPGAPILEIVPDEEMLIVRAQISPMDIDVVRPGLKAQVVFPAFSQRKLPQLQGEVVAVSADALEDERTGASFYSAEVRISDASMARIGAGGLAPGMIANVQIVTGSRTPLQYLLEPLTGMFGKAFKET